MFSPEYAAESGYLQTDCPELLKNYDIRFFDAEGRSRSFYDYVAEHLNDLKLIAVCTGSEELNAEISDNLMLFLKRHGAEQICVIQCGRDGVRYQESVGSPIIRAEIYSLAFLDAEIADRSAILLNSSYDRTDRSDWEKWLACDSFSKASSRASADFTPALIRSLSSSREEILADGWKPSSEQLRNLGETEHRRWCAFHYSMGYRPMSREEMKHRARLGLRVSKDQETRSHACLIPWEKLDELSAFETGLTGESVDYKQLDINNVLAIPKLLRAEEKK